MAVPATREPKRDARPASGASTATTEATAGSATRASLRGLDYADQVQLLTPSGGAPTAPAATAATVQMKGEDEGFKKVAEAETPLSQKDTPDSIQLPDEVEKGMSEAWGDSFPNKKSQEQGGIMVREKDGSYGFVRGAAGKSGSFPPNYGDKKADQEVVGSAHTHPYDESEGGHEGVAFSGGDIANLVYQPDKLKMVKAGETEFVLVRTAEFQKLVDEADTEGKKTLHKEIKDTWNSAFKGAKGDFVTRCEIAVKATVEKYKLSFYKGKEGKVDRVDTSK